MVRTHSVKLILVCQDKGVVGSTSYFFDVCEELISIGKVSRNQDVANRCLLCVWREVGQGQSLQVAKLVATV